VTSPRWDEVRAEWDADHENLVSLRDVYVVGATVDDWQRAVDVVRACWPTSYLEDGEPASMPPVVADVLARSRHVAVTWRISLAERVGVKSHFFASDEIEFDVAARHVRGQRELDALWEFVRTIGDALRKPVVVTHENEPSAVILRYEPGAGDGLER
jgi:hypothetical protein